MDTSKDHLTRRCPRLGGEIDFQYCRTVVNGPCGKILDCWWERFDVAGFMKENLCEKEFEALVAQKPPQKVTTLIEMIRNAKNNLNKNQNKKTE